MAYRLKEDSAYVIFIMFVPYFLSLILFGIIDIFIYPDLKKLWFESEEMGLSYILK